MSNCISFALKINKIGNMKYSIVVNNNIFSSCIANIIPNSTITKSTSSSTISFYASYLLPFDENYYGNYNFKNIIQQQKYLENYGLTMQHLFLEDLFIIGCGNYELLLCLNENNIYKIDKKRTNITNFYYEFGLFINNLYPNISEYPNKIGYFVKRLLNRNKNSRIMLLI